MPREKKRIFSYVLAALLICCTFSVYLIFVCAGNDLKLIGEFTPRSMQSGDNGDLPTDTEENPPDDHDNDEPDLSRVIIRAVAYDQFVYAESIDSKFIILQGGEQLDIDSFDEHAEYCGLNYTFIENGFLGVCSLLGETIAEPCYLNYSQFGSTILLTSATEYVVISEGKECSRVAKSIFPNISLYSENYLLFDGRLYALDFVQAIFENNYIVSETNADGWLIVQNIQSNKIGFVNSVTGARIAAVYDSASNFVGKYAQVWNFATSKSSIINERGEVVRELGNGQLLIWSDSEHVIIRDNGLYLIYDASRNFITAQLLLSTKVYSDYVVCEGNILFNLESGEIVLCENIKEAGSDCLIIKNNGKYSLVNKNLDILISDSDDIIVCGDIVLSQLDGAYQIAKLSELLVV